MSLKKRKRGETCEHHDLLYCGHVFWSSEHAPIQESLSMGDNELFDNIRETVEKINELRDLAYVQYSKAVDEVLTGQITNESQIEHILGGIIDFGDDSRFLNLSKKLCHYI